MKYLNFIILFLLTICLILLAILIKEYREGSRRLSILEEAVQHNNINTNWTEQLAIQNRDILKTITSETYEPTLFTR